MSSFANKIICLATFLSLVEISLCRRIGGGVIAVDDGEDGLSTGEIIGIVVGVLGGIILLLSFIGWLRKRKEAKAQPLPTHNGNIMVTQEKPIPPMPYQPENPNTRPPPTFTPQFPQPPQTGYNISPSYQVPQSYPVPPQSPYHRN